MAIKTALKINSMEAWIVELGVKVSAQDMAMGEAMTEERLHAMRMEDL